MGNLSCKDRGLILPLQLVEEMINLYIDGDFLPICDRYNWSSVVFNVSNNSFFHSELTSDKFEELLWKIFGQDDIFFLQEMLSVIALLCHAEFNEKIKLLSNLYICQATNSFSRDDIVVGLEVTANGISRLWSEEINFKKFHSLSESLSDRIFAKFGVDIEGDISANQLKDWIKEYFGASFDANSGRKVCSIADLAEIFEHM